VRKYQAKINLTIEVPDESDYTEASIKSNLFKWMAVYTEDEGSWMQPEGSEVCIEEVEVRLME
jgi:hypothetical protein